ncbi:MAG TPA: DegT/DnrJ/EryC1/StrS family aminotransferase [Mobilitalea sp.]|nr:DegT/DnrJ/EryC1/StrS family aminotransferase [Mobilitalea sp.]
MKIPLIDLKAGYLSLKDEIDASITSVLSGGNYILGPNVKALEEEIADYCGTKFAVSVANGTDALVLCLDAYGIGPGDEVITSPYSFFATAEAISRVGAVPVFVDIDETSYNIDYRKIESSISKHTKAIIPVHLFGQPAIMDKIMELANRYNLVVIEDACQAIGASYKGCKTGALGHAGCFSFFPTKNLGGYGDGGMITTNNEELAGRIRMLRAHGSSKKYYNSIIGYNSRLDELQAAILRVKLRHLDRWNEARRTKAERYNYLLQGLGFKLPKAESEAEHVYHLYILSHPKRAEIMKGLESRQIGCGIYYPVPLHRQEAYKQQYSNISLPVVEAASKETFAIPLFPEMTDEQQTFVVAELKKILEEIER